jgi:hypothetical protein
MTENERFGLVFARTGSINSCTSRLLVGLNTEFNQVEILNIFQKFLFVDCYYLAIMNAVKALSFWISPRLSHRKPHG